MNASKENLRWIRPGLQKRSQASFDRILNAAESLLGDRSFDELTISDVVRRAKSSVGAFYTRFSNKDALLDALYQRHQDQAIATMERYLAPEQWESASVEQIVTQIVGFAVRYHRDHRGLLRALVLRGQSPHTWRSWSFQKGSRRTRFRILPEPVRGISSRKDTLRGTL